jgi:hydrogenase-4 component E
MIHPVDTILSLALLSILFSFGSSRLPGLIKVLAFQGVVVSIVPLTIGHEMSTGGVIFTIVTLTIRGIVIPGCIYLAIKKVAIGREVEPIVGYHASILAGLLLIVGATFASHRIDVPYSSVSALLLPTAISLLGAGMFLLDGPAQRHRHGAGLHHDGKRHLPGGHHFSTRARHIVEFGILLDVLAGVMIMAVILQNIKQTFDDVDTARLRTLKE